jgi:hypothetical protein
MRAGHLAWITYRDMMCEVEAGRHARRLGRTDAARLPACADHRGAPQELQEVWR